MKPLTTFLVCLLFLLTACAGKGEVKPGELFPLAEFNESEVSVEIGLLVTEDGQAWLEAIFSPEEGHHLYSKDLPFTGSGGLGRPTLLELLPGARMKAMGALEESVPAFEDENIDGLLVYPPGPVTLRLPIRLPEGTGWHDEKVALTYMACREGACCPPVVGRLIEVRVPGEGEVTLP